MCPGDNLPRETTCPGDNVPRKAMCPGRQCAPEGKPSLRKYALEKMCPGDNVTQRQCALEDIALVWPLLVGFGTVYVPIQHDMWINI